VNKVYFQAPNCQSQFSSVFQGCSVAVSQVLWFEDLNTSSKADASNQALLTSNTLHLISLLKTV
jgi:hypothetical protein